jgi:hypothetical protein
MKLKFIYMSVSVGLLCSNSVYSQNVGIGEPSPQNAKLEVKGNLIIGSNYTGGSALSEPNGATIEGRSIIGEDVFHYTIDKFVAYGNTNHTASSATGPDNGNGLSYAVNGYTHDGHAIYGEDNDGGVGVEANVSGSSSNRAKGIYGLENSGTGTGVHGVSTNSSLFPTSGYIGVHGVESTLTGWAILGSGDINATSNYYNISDSKLKQNVVPLTSALSLITKLLPKQYDMKWEEYRLAGFDRRPQMGFIAQELEQVLPNLVKNTFIPLNDANFTKEEIAKNPELAKKETSILEVKAVNYVQLIPLLTQAIKEQQEQISELKEMILSQNKIIGSLTK